MSSVSLALLESGGSVVDDALIVVVPVLCEFFGICSLFWCTVLDHAS